MKTKKSSTNFENDTLSFIICAYKDSPYLEDCIKSLINQNIRCFVAISTSTPTDNVRSLAKKYDVPLYINKNGNGYHDDFKFAFDKAPTKYVTLCHQDDIYMNNFSGEVIKKINKNDDNIIIFSNYYDYKNNNVIKRSNFLFIKRLMNFPLSIGIFQKMKFIRRFILSFGNSICSPTVTFNKEKVDEPVVNCHLKTSHDWFTWIDFCKIDGRFVYIKKATLKRRINELSDTTSFIADNSKKKSDLEIFKMMWPKWIASIISKVYGLSEKNNELSNNLDLLIIDDIFPVKTSTFRYQEFSYLLKAISNVKILSTFESIRYSGITSKKKLLTATDLEMRKSIIDKLPKNINECKMLYGIFLFNTYKYILPIAEKYHIPFAFTLYPGGRFNLNDSESDRMLYEIFNSKYFRKVIVTQKVTYDYIIEKRLCSKEKIAYIYGGILLEERLNKRVVSKKNNNEINICFVAFKYSKIGEDKGYDIFVKVSKKLSKYNNIKFHVVGNFDENTIPLDNLENISFYGIRSPEWFDDFYSKMDIILSPNISGKINSGSFDGFPTSATLEAGLNEVAMFCTDCKNLNQNNFVDKEEIIIIKHDVNDICKKILYYCEHVDELHKIGKNGRKKIKKLYSYEAQINPRIEIINDIINNDNFVKEKKKYLFNIKINTIIKISYFSNYLYGKLIRK